MTGDKQLARIPLRDNFIVDETGCIEQRRFLMNHRSCRPLARRVEGVRRTCSSINPLWRIDRFDRIRATASNNRACTYFRRTSNVG